MPEPQNQPADDGAGDAAAAAAAAAAGTAAKPTEDPKLSMTQAEFDRIIADRVARAKPKDYDELVKIRDAQKAAEEGEKTELQKEKDARLAAEQKATERNSKADAKLRRAAILTEAAKQNAIDAEVIAELLKGNEDIAVDDEGEVTGVTEAVKALLKQKPVLVKGKPGASGTEFGGNDPASIAEQIATLERAGKYAEARDLKVRQMAGLRTS